MHLRAIRPSRARAREAGITLSSRSDEHACALARMGAACCGVTSTDQREPPRTVAHSNWLRQIAGKRDHREVLRDDYVVIRPGPNFDWLMGNLAAGQLPAPAPERNPAGDDRSEAVDRAK